MMQLFFWRIGPTAAMNMSVAAEGIIGEAIITLKKMMEKNGKTDFRLENSPERPPPLFDTNIYDRVFHVPDDALYLFQMWVSTRGFLPRIRRENEALWPTDGLWTLFELRNIAHFSEDAISEMIESQLVEIQRNEVGQDLFVLGPDAAAGRRALDPAFDTWRMLTGRVPGLEEQAGRYGIQRKQGETDEHLRKRLSEAIMRL